LEIRDETRGETAVAVDGKLDAVAAEGADADDEGVDVDVDSKGAAARLVCPEVLASALRLIH
jgi:hypothetical protein